MGVPRESESGGIGAERLVLALSLLIALLMGGCSPSVTQRPIRMVVLALPETAPGAVLDLTEPLPGVPGATIEIPGTGLKVVTDSTGTGSLKVPLDVVTFRIHPPQGSVLKPATYKQEILEYGTDTLGFVLSPDGELNVDNSISGQSTDSK